MCQSLREIFWTMRLVINDAIVGERQMESYSAFPGEDR